MDNEELMPELNIKKAKTEDMKELIHELGRVKIKAEELQDKKLSEEIKKEIEKLEKIIHNHSH